jgi:hypothetical protein
VGWGETVHLVSRPRNGLLYQPRMMDKYGIVGEMRTGRGNRSTWSKPAPVSLFPPQIPHDLTWVRTRAVEVETTYLLTINSNFSSHSTLYNVGNLNKVLNSPRFCQSLTPNAESILFITRADRVLIYLQTLLQLQKLQALCQNEVHG